MRRQQYVRNMQTSVWYSEPWKVSIGNLLGNDVNDGFGFRSESSSLQPLGLLIKQANDKAGQEELELDLTVRFTHTYEYGGRRDSDGGLVPSYSDISINDIDVTIKRIPKIVDPNLFVIGINKYLGRLTATLNTYSIPGMDKIFKVPELKRFVVANVADISFDLYKSKAYLTAVVREMEALAKIGAADLFKVVGVGGDFYDIIIISKEYLGQIQDDLRYDENLVNEL